MRPLLVLVAALAFPALAAELPSIDTPLRTGLSAKGDAAVVIGVENYVYLPQATYASQDAQAMYGFLVYTRGVPISRVALLQGGTSRRKIIEAVTTAGKQVGAGGTVWVYFAGHGSASPSTRERLILPENTLADAGDFDEQGVRLAELQRLAGSGGGEVMLITDACFTGAGRAGGTLLSDGRAWVPPQATAVKRSVQWDAAQPNQVAGPLHTVQHGAFTYFAIGAMRGWADGQVTGARDGVVTSGEAHLYVQEALRAVGIRDQAPALVGEGAAARTLASGATERAPALGDVMATPTALAPVAVGDASVVGGAGFQAGLEKAKREAAVRAEKEFRERAEAQARARAAETERVESERRAAAAAAARKVKLDAAEGSLRAQATSDWGAAKALVDGGGAGAKAAAEAFVKAYEGATVSVDTEDRLVAIPELAAAKKVAALRLVETAAPASLRRPARRGVNLGGRNHGVLEAKLLQTWATGGSAQFGASFTESEKDGTTGGWVVSTVAWPGEEPTLADLGDVTTSVLAVEHGGGWGVFRAGWYLGVGGTGGAPQKFSDEHSTLYYAPSWSWSLGLRGGVFLPYDVVAPYLDYRAGVWTAVGTARVGEVSTAAPEDDGEPGVPSGAVSDFTAVALAHGPCLGLEVVPGGAGDGKFLLDAALMYNIGPGVTGWSLHIGAGVRL